ncbi:hypothetical protein ACLOJK_029634, partial [Asimina triloba]
MADQVEEWLSQAGKPRILLHGRIRGVGVSGDGKYAQIDVISYWVGRTDELKTSATPQTLVLTKR